MHSYQILLGGGYELSSVKRQYFFFVLVLREVSRRSRYVSLYAVAAFAKVSPVPAEIGEYYFSLVDGAYRSQLLPALYFQYSSSQ